MRIGVRELRKTLTQQLASVKEGHSVTITSHGRPVARLVPIDEPAALDRLRDEGLIRAPQNPRRRLPAPVKTAGIVSDLIADQRG